MQQFGSVRLILASLSSNRTALVQHCVSLWHTSGWAFRTASVPKQIAANRTAPRLRQSTTSRSIDFIHFIKCFQSILTTDLVYHTLRSSLATNGGTVQNFSMLGYGPEVPVQPALAIWRQS